MAFDGDAWDETIPTNSDLANEIDDYMRDIKKAVRARMSLEHFWPSSQAATNEGGWHTYITMSVQTSAPGLVVGTHTAEGALYIASGNQHLTFKDSAGNSYTVAHSGLGVTFFGGTGAIGDIPYVTSGGGMVALAAGSSGYLLAAQGTTSAPAYVAQSSITVPQYVAGQVNSSIIQYATGTVSAGGTATISFGTNFANTAYSVVFSVEDIGGSLNLAQVPSIRAKAVGSVTVYNGNGGNVGVSVMAVGSAG